MFRRITQLFFITLLSVSTQSQAQDYPSRNITIIVPFSAGSASDVMTRIVAEKMFVTGGTRRIVIENRPAAGGNVGTGAVAKADPDGYTLLASASGPLAANKALYPKLGYDPETDFAPIALFASLPNIIVVSAKTPLTTLAEMIEYIKKTPKVPYSSVGNGSSQHLAGAYFEQLVGVQMNHIPYRITSQLQADLVSGEVPVSFQLLPNVVGQIKAGQIRALAVASTKRLPALPNVPTAGELGVKGYESAAWFAFVAPKGTPRAIVDRVNKEIASAMADPAVRARFNELGAEPHTSSPEELARFISAEVTKWRGIITRGGITIDPQ